MKLMPGSVRNGSCDECGDERRVAVYWDERIGVHWVLCMSCLCRRTIRELERLRERLRT